MNTQAAQPATPTPNRRRRATPRPKTRAELVTEFDSLPPNCRLSESHVAAVRGCSVALLQRERVFGSPIPFIREGGTLKTDRNGMTRIFGGRIFFYLKTNVLKYLEGRNRRVSSTSEISANQQATQGANK